MFISKLTYLIIIVLLSIFIFINKDKKYIKYIIYSFSLILAYIFTNSMMLLVAGVSDVEVFFQRDFFDIIYVNLLEFSILILLGAIYDFSNKKYIINFLFGLLILSCSVISFHIFPNVLYEKYKVKQAVYDIDKYNLIYSTLGETTIFPKSLLLFPPVAAMTIFKFECQYFVEQKPNFVEHMSNRIFNGEYYDYRKYFLGVYKKPFIGATFVDDEIADAELKKRLFLLDEEFSAFEFDKEITNYVSFKNLYKKFKEKKYSVQELTDIEKEKGKNPIITKAIAYAYYNEEKYAESITKYLEYISSNPKDYDANLNLGNAYANIDEKENALKYYLKAYEIDNKNFMVLYKLLNLYLYSFENFEKSIEICDQMIEIEERMYTLYINKAIVYSYFNSYENAKKSMNEAKDKNNIVANIWLRDINEKDLAEKLRILYPTYN